MIGLLRPYRGRLILMFAALLLEMGAGLAPPYLLGKAIDKIRSVKHFLGNRRRGDVRAVVRLVARRPPRRRREFRRTWSSYKKHSRLRRGASATPRLEAALLGADAQVDAQLLVVEHRFGPGLARRAATPTKPARNAAVIETMAGFLSGKSAVGLPSRSTQTVGLMTISSDRQEGAGEDRRHRAGGGEAPPDDRQQQRREVGAARDGEGEADHERDVLALEQRCRAARPRRRTTTVAMRATRTCFGSRGLPACARRARRCRATAREAPASVRPATTARMVAKATAAMKPRNGVPPSSSASSGAAMLPPASMPPITSRPTSADGAEADDGDDQVEVADEAGGVEHRRARRPGVRHGVEAHQDVRQPEQAEHQRQSERDGVDRIGHQPARLERRLAVARRDRRVEARRSQTRTAPAPAP